MEHIVMELDACVPLIDLMPSVLIPSLSHGTLHPWPGHLHARGRASPTFGTSDIQNGPTQNTLYSVESHHIENKAMII